MKLRKTIKAILTMGLTTCFFNYSVAQSFPNPIRDNLSIKAGIESRTTDFRWSIAGNTSGEDPNIFSEIIFNPVRSAGYYFDASYRFYKNFSLSARYNWLKTYNGMATDFDYAEDNRTSPTTELYLKSDKGNMRSFGVDVSYAFVNKPNLYVESGISYNGSKELFYLLDNNNKELNTTYETDWRGPSLQLKGKWNSKYKVFFGGGISFYYLNYYAKANWNLIKEFQHPLSFEHRVNSYKSYVRELDLDILKIKYTHLDIFGMNAYGSDYTAFAGYQFTKHFSTTINWLYSNWKTKPGVDRLYLTNGEIPETQMNGAFKKSSGWRLSATYTF